MVGERKQIELDKQLLEGNNYRFVEELRRGRKVIVIEDLTPWVKQRKGYDVGVKRGDVLYLKHGKAKNKPIQGYSSESSCPVFSYFEGSAKQSVIKNLSFIRHPNSTAISYLFYIDSKDNVLINNVSIFTPSSDLFADQAITICRSTNVIFDRITIEGTYSGLNKYGYGISMNNVWNTRFINLMADCKWGVFGNYNVSKTSLESCDINRFDIHCYGKDVFCYNSVFRNLYNQFASFYGELYFEKCSFISFVPVLLEDSFGAYTPFKVVFKDCEITVDEQRPFLISTGDLSSNAFASRVELKDVHFPSVTFSNVHLILPENLSKYYIYSVIDQNSPSIIGDNAININGMVINNNRNDVSIEYSSNKLMHDNYPSIIIKKSSINDINFY